MPDNSLTPTPIPEPEEDSWNLKVVAKKIGYTLAKWKASTAGGVALGPTVYAIVEQINGLTKPFGIQIHIDEILFEKMGSVSISMIEAQRL